MILLYYVTIVKMRAHFDTEEENLICKEKQYGKSVRDVNLQKETFGNSIYNTT